MVDKNAVAFIAHVKRNVFVSLLAASAAVFVPDFNALWELAEYRSAVNNAYLSILDERPEALA